MAQLPTPLRSTKREYDPLQAEMAVWDQYKGLLNLPDVEERVLPPPGNPLTPMAARVADVLGLTDAYRAVRGGMTEGEAKDFAFNSVLGLSGPGGVAKPLMAVFAGVAAKTANKSALKLAEQMAARGFPREQIWDATGWFKGVDGEWKFEIPDSAAAVTGRQGNTVNQNLAHSELYAAYPELGDVRMSYGERIGAAAWYPDAGRIAVSGLKPPDTPSLYLHELQHAVQTIEGFARGGSPKAIRDLIPEPYASSENPQTLDALAREAYKRLAGEVEARNVETRASLTPDARRRAYPWATEDRTPEVQTVLKQKAKR